MATGSHPIPADMAVATKLSGFNVVDIDYKQVNGVGIAASILTPKDARSGCLPVLVRWHGGCLITGHRMFPDWFGNWILELALKVNAIIITPDYRLMPEANGLDILRDVRDFYNWLATPNNLDDYLPDGVSASLNSILVTGESAGGWLALQSALLPASREKIAGVISHYPMIDMRDRYWTEDYEKQIFTPVAPQLPRNILQDYVDGLKGGEVVSSATPPDRVPLVISSLQQGRLGRFLGDDSSLYPIEVLDSVNDLPPTWILHGTGDTVVPIAGTYKYEKALREKLPNTKLHVSYQPGDHGFDNDPSVSLNTDWVKEGVAFIEQFWPSK